MYKKLYVTVFALLLCIQASIQLDPVLQKCKDKLIEQISQVKFGQYPKCFDASKLSEMKNSTDVMQDFFQTLSQNCRTPTVDDIKGCLENFKEFMKARSSDIQAGILGAIHSFFEASRGCLASFVDKVSNLDQWVLNGCEDVEGSQ